MSALFFCRAKVHAGSRYCDQPTVILPFQRQLACATKEAERKERTPKLKRKLVGGPGQLEPGVLCLGGGAQRALRASPLPCPSSFLTLRYYKNLRINVERRNRDEGRREEEARASRTTNS